MNDVNSTDQTPYCKLVFLHIFTGGLVLLFQYLTVDFFIERNYPPYISGLFGFLFVSIPLQLFIITWNSSKKISVIKHLLGKETRNKARIIIPVLITFFVFNVIYSQISVWFQRKVFYWLPNWLLVPILPDSIPSNIVLIVFIVTLTIDGILNPIVEELYWRGYLLQKLSFIGEFAYIINGVLFGVQHFWQPYNYCLIIPYSILLSYIVWREGNLRLSIFIHCTINSLGALITFLPLLR